MMSQGEPRAAILTAKEGFLLTSGTQRQKADIRRKLKKEFAIIPVMLDKNELIRNRLVRTSMFRSHDIKLIVISFFVLNIA